MSDKSLKLETVKLLVQVAWADHEITDEEINFILDFAGKADLDGQDVAAISEALHDRAKLPVPDLGLLRAHADSVLETVSNLIMIDNEIVKDEMATMKEIRALLKGD
jgi:hypothetical protein